MSLPISWRYPSNHRAETGDSLLSDKTTAKKVADYTFQILMGISVVFVVVVVIFVL